MKTFFDKRVIKAKMLIEDNTDIFFTCEELSGYCRISAKQLGRLFKKYEGIGLLEYIHRQKTEAAKECSKSLTCRNIGLPSCSDFPITGILISFSSV